MISDILIFSSQRGLSFLAGPFQCLIRNFSVLEPRFRQCDLQSFVSFFVLIIISYYFRQRRETGFRGNEDVCEDVLLELVEALVDGMFVEGGQLRGNLLMGGC